VCGAACMQHCMMMNERMPYMLHFFLLVVFAGSFSSLFTFFNIQPLFGEQPVSNLSKYLNYL
jgi:hypothetical protein